MKIIISCCRSGTSEEQCSGQEAGRGWRWLKEAGEPTHQGDEVTRTEIEAKNWFSTFHRRLFIHALKAPLAVEKLATLLGPKINNLCMHQPPFYRMQRRWRGTVLTDCDYVLLQVRVPHARMSRSVWPCTAAPALRMLPPRPSLAGHLVPRWPSLAGHLVILWLLQSVTVLGYRSTDPEHITAILGQTVMY